ncbi:succinoglycan biosynthesis protein exop [Deinococcus sp. KSM4-11]|uniref:succinoglycan biosynthesis protein exop n=1 Tax=Deinococcus sp. KSM4-11 TaxID=2568654 RepID=UPI0010A44E6F|nr:succinoglycan biosynthesis protein exop [Deinococcus sp. KSM4-11]THF87266.1 succinoglycan biosynthesis protein exop [Deinococcus sp. KSM4-11]
MRLTLNHDIQPQQGQLRSHDSQDEAEIDFGRLREGLYHALPWILGGSILIGAAVGLYERTLSPTFSATTNLITTTPATVGNLRDTLVAPVALPDGTLEDALHGPVVVNHIIELLNRAPTVTETQRKAFANQLTEELLNQRYNTIKVTSRVDFSGNGVYKVNAFATTGPLAAVVADTAAQALLDWDQGRALSGVRRAEQSLREQLMEVNRQLARPGLPVENRQVLLTSRAQVQRNLVQAAIQAQGVTGLLSQVAPAVIPMKAAAPHPVRDVLIAVALSVLLLGGLAAVRSALDTSVRNEDDLLSLGLSTMAAFPRLKKRVTESQGIVLAARGSAMQEAVGFLLLNLNAAGGAHQNQRIVVTSATSGAGTSSVVAILADAAAAIGMKVLIVDASGEDGTQAQLWAYARGSTHSAVVSPGENLAVDNAVAPGIQLVTVGMGGRWPVRGGDTGAADGLGEGYDLVLIDAPPLLYVADALDIARHTGHLLLVVEAGSTPIQTVRQALRRASQAGVAVLGTVINKATQSATPGLRPVLRSSLLPRPQS